MKMRKKLAAVLAAAMIASVMPMTAFAKSSNSVTNVVKFAKETPLNINTAPKLKIKMDHDLTTDSAFYLELTGAEWDTLSNMQAAITNDAGVTLAVERTSKKFLTIRATNVTVPAGKTITVPLLTTLKGGEAKVAIDGDSTAVTSGEFIFANSSEGVVSEVVVADAGNFAENGTVSTITIKEPYAGAYAATYGAGDFVEFELELRDTDFKFVQKTHASDMSKRTRVIGRKGFNFEDHAFVTSVTNDTVTVKIPKANIQSISNQAGEILLTNVGITTTNRKAAKGEVKAILRGKGTHDIIGGAQSAVIAKYSNFTTKLEMKKDYEVQAGKEVAVEFTLSEEIADSMLNNRAVTFSLSGGAKFQSGANITVTAKDAGAITTPTADANDKYRSFEVDKFAPNGSDAAKYIFKAVILVPNNFEDDEVKLTVEGKAISETHEVVAAKVTRPVSVEVTPMDVKVGLKQQTGGKIVIKENVKEAILRNYKDVAGNSIGSASAPATIDIRIGDDYGWNTDGLRITDADIKVTEGDLVLDLDAKVFAGGYISIPVKRQSTVPSTVEITNVVVDATRSVPEGKYAIKVGGEALSKNTQLNEFLADKAFKADFHSGDTRFFDSIVTKDFINITTKNTEDFKGTTTAKVAFTVGAEKYLINDAEATLDAAPYIKDGRTMLPVRAVATALGINNDQVIWNQSTQTATILADKTIQVKLGSKDMIVNGVVVPMTAAAELKSDRIFVPVAEIARALGVTVAWDEATQTATFN